MTGTTRALRSGVVALVALAAVACGSSGPATGPVELGGSPPSTPSADPGPARVDPRRGGFEIGFGEFAVTLEAPAIRPGPVTFVIRNGGELVHGFEMEAEGEDDSSGPGSGDDGRFKIERPSFGPRETIRFDLDLAPGLYKIECWVENHDDLGMEALLEVREDAPKIRSPRGDGDSVAIRGFRFQPETLEVAGGSQVRWTNEDPEEHTVTAEDGSFDSGPIGQGETFSADAPPGGSVTYICRIHPAMRGTIRARR